MKNKNSLKYLIVVLVCFQLLVSLPKEAYSAEPYVEAESAILIDVASGRVLFEKNAHKSRPMASITKITTAIVALEKGNLKDVVTISKRAAETGEASIWLEEGEKHTLEDLLYALMMRSANDGAVAIAEHLGGSVEGFADMMTQRAKELGAKDTQYKNPHGLHDDAHYTTAYDMAIITRHAMLKLPKFKELITTRKRTMDWGGSDWDRVLINQNKLLNRYSGANGVKTGFTDEAGKTFVASATRDGRQLIAVVMKTPDIYAESTALLDYGFNEFNGIKVIEQQKFDRHWPVANGIKELIKVKLERDILMSLKQTEQSKIKLVTEVPQNLKAPIKKGEKIGQVKVIFNGEELEAVNVLAMEHIEEKSLWSSLWQRIIGFFTSLFRVTTN